MTGPTTAEREARRASAVRALGILDTPRELVFDETVAMVARQLGCPMAFLTFLDGERCWMKATFGFGLQEIARADSFCTFTVDCPEDVDVFPDATADPRVRDNPYVVGKPGLRFYAGAPIRTADGEPVGVLSVADVAPRRLDERDRLVLRDAARLVEHLLEFRRSRLDLQHLTRAAESAESREGGSGKGLFRGLARRMAETLRVRTALICEHVPGERRARTLGFFDGNRALEDVEYALDGTPCGAVEERGALTVDRGLRARFPEDRILDDLNAESYVGLALHDDSGATIGHVAVLHDGPLPSAGTAAGLRLFASRARFEIERMRRERLLRESEARFRATFEQAGVGITQCDLDGRFMRANPRMAEILGYERHELENASFQARTHPDDLPRNLERMRETLAGERNSYTMEKRYIRKYGTHRWARVTVVLVRDDAGAPQYFITVAEDIHERKRAEREQRRLARQFHESQKMESLGVLAGGIAHDFNNLLTGILGNAELAQMSLPEDSPALEPLRHVETASLRAADLVAQMLAYAGKSRPVVAPIDLGALVREMADLLRSVISKKAELRIEVEAELPAVPADASQLRQVVMNLITNASDALQGEPGTIAVGVGGVGGSSGGGGVFLEVRDTGVGMDAETLRRMFDPFFSTKFSGRGLGLSAVHGIVRGHDGTLAVDSRPGEGARIRIVLPSCAERPATVPARRAGGEGWRGSGAVLVVDDEPSVRRIASEVLRRHGFEVETATDGRRGLARLAAMGDRPPRALLLDLTMPELGGLQVLRRLRRTDPRLPVVLMSGYPADDAVRELLRDGRSAFLHKPFIADDLLRTLREVLEPESTRAPGREASAEPAAPTGSSRSPASAPPDGRPPRTP